jgi:hypothetical protein
MRWQHSVHHRLLRGFFSLNATLLAINLSLL